MSESEPSSVSLPVESGTQAFDSARETRVFDSASSSSGSCAAAAAAAAPPVPVATALTPGDDFVVVSDDEGSAGCLPCLLSPTVRGAYSKFARTHGVYECLVFVKCRVCVCRPA